MTRRIVRAWRLLVVLALVVLAIVLFVFMRGSATPQGYEWRFVTWESDPPQTQVTLVADGESTIIGTYKGTCAVQEGEYLEYEVSKVVCWYAGAGQEIGIFEEPGQVVVRVGDIDEGASGVPGFRGNFVLVKTIK